MCERYNGFENRESWAMALWLNNDQNLGNPFRDFMQTHVEDQVHDEPVADWWKFDGFAFGYANEWADTWLTPNGYIFAHGDDWPMELANIASDIGSLYRINWHEVMDAVLPED
jgi:hypothetical protein